MTNRHAVAAHLLCTVLFALPLAAPAESIASAAASSASVTASSASDSLGASSNSSKSGGNNTARAGDFRIEAVAAAEQPGRVRLVLEPLAPEADRLGFVLTLPQAALAPQRLTRGDTVRVRERAYGFEFARADTSQAFFLVLADEWQRELAPRQVTAARPAL